MMAFHIGDVYTLKSGNINKLEEVCTEMTACTIISSNADALSQHRLHIGLKLNFKHQYYYVCLVYGFNTYALLHYSSSQ